MPVSGAWRLTYSMGSTVNSWNSNLSFLYINGGLLDESSRYRTFSETGQVLSTGGRVVTVEASAGDKIEIRATTVDGSYWRIIFCAEFISKM